jgi:5'-nucleotidase (lipoprotein e(P4) family)
MNRYFALSLALLVGTASCASPRTPASAPKPATAHVDTLPNDVKWVRLSAEYQAIAREVYAMAGDRLFETAASLRAQSWAVILDADETVLDNSEYQRRLAASHAQFDAKSWTAWVNERAAPAVPGALEFTKRVHSLGGRVAIVTNRSMAECDATRENLKSIGVEADLVLCQPPGESNKNPRFRRVQVGAAAPGVPALTVVEWLGDNIQDFPSLTQSARTDSTALSEFGRRYFVLPNPMYGSWDQLH